MVCQFCFQVKPRKGDGEETLARGRGSEEGVPRGSPGLFLMDWRLSECMPLAVGHPAQTRRSFIISQDKKPRGGAGSRAPRWAALALLLLLQLHSILRETSSLPAMFKNQCEIIIHASQQTFSHISLARIIQRSISKTISKGHRTVVTIPGKPFTFRRRQLSLSPIQDPWNGRNDW